MKTRSPAVRSRSATAAAGRAMDSELTADFSAMRSSSEATLAETRPSETAPEFDPAASGPFPRSSPDSNSDGHAVKSPKLWTRVSSPGMRLPFAMCASHFFAISLKRPICRHGLQRIVVPLARVRVRDCLRLLVWDGIANQPGTARGMAKTQFRPGALGIWSLGIPWVLGHWALVIISIPAS